jgi:hypothetical protein
LSKDTLWADWVVYTGLKWEIGDKHVSLPSSKQEKYRETVMAWKVRVSHTLEEVRRIYGQLLHVTKVVPSGRAYLTSFESMLAIYHDRPHMPRRAPKVCAEEVEWWLEELQKPLLSRPIPGWFELIDIGAFSDASSETNIAVIIGGRWRAWRLLPNWKSKAEHRDIAWAEAVGFEILAMYCAGFGTPKGSHILLHGDNRGVVEGWWNGRSRHRGINSVFRRVNVICNEAQIHVHSRYVESGSNPADAPSRGKYPPEVDILPQIKLPRSISQWLANYEDPLTPHEVQLQVENSWPTPKRKEARAGQAESAINSALRSAAEGIREACWSDSSSPF